MAYFKLLYAGPSEPVGFSENPPWQDPGVGVVNDMLQGPVNTSAA